MKQYKYGDTAAVRTDSDAATGPVVDDARCCDLCTEPFVPSDGEDGGVCSECVDACAEADELDRLTGRAL